MGAHITDILPICFQVFFLVVVFGLFHGLAFLPVLLSWIGPSPYLSADKRYQDPEFNHHEHPHLAGVDNRGMDMKPVSTKINVSR